jgi:predicted Zn-dependent peptidase
MYPAMLRPSPSRNAVFLALAGALLAARPAVALEDPAERTRVTRLPNGLIVLTLEDRTTPIVSFQMWVKVGSRDEPRYTGLAHLFEHMMFKGSKHIEPERHAQLINARGGRLNAYTNRDHTVYFSDVPSESLPLVIDLEHERVAHLDISDATLTSEREVVLEERRMRTEDTPTGRAYEALPALMWQAHPYRWPVIGWRSDVEQTTVEACREFFDAYYSVNNMAIALVGDFDTESALAQLRRTFGALPPAPQIPRNPTREPPQKGERRGTVHFDLSSPVLAAGWHAPPTGHADGEALDVLSVILSDGRSSRLYRSLVYDGQQALSAYGSYWDLTDAGSFQAFVSVRPDASIERAEELLLAEVERLEREPVSSAELEKAKRQIEVSLVNGMATNHALATRIARDYTTFGRVRPLDERLARIQAVTAADVQRVVLTYLVDEQRSVVRVVPPAAGEAGEVR